MQRPVDPEAIGFGDLLQRYRLRPAEIQRDYVWTGEQVRALLADLFAYLDRKNGKIGTAGYFIGSFVGFEDVPGDIRLYDGLQRTITLTLLMAMVRDLLGGEPLAHALHDCIADETGVFRFQIDGEDDTLRRYVQPIGASRRWPKTQKVLNRFVVLDEARRTVLEDFGARGILEGGLITKQGRNRLRGLAAALCNDIYLIHLKAESQPIALRMFETVNMRGVAMEDVDLIKTRLPTIATTREEAAALMAQWDRLRGRVRYAFADFVLAVGVLFRNHGMEPEAAPYEALTDWMRRQRGDDPARLADWFETLLGYAEAWNDLHAVQRPEWMGSPGLAPLRPIWVIDWFEWKPYALALVREWHLRRDEARRKRRSFQPVNAWLAGHLDRLQRSAMALEIAGDEGRRRRLFFSGALRILLQTPDTADPLPPIKAPRQRRIRNTLSGPLEDRGFRLRLLTWLEAVRDPSGVARLMAVGADTPTVEHILPQNPLPESDWYDRFNDPVSLRRSRNLLGNLVLLPSDINGAMENSDYGRKRAIALDQLDGRAGFWTAKSAFAAEDWDQEMIDQRTQALGEAIWQALRLGPDMPLFNTTRPVDPEDLLLDADAANKPRPANDTGEAPLAG